MFLITAADGRLTLVSGSGVFQFTGKVRMVLKKAISGKLSNKWQRACRDCANVKLLQGYDIIAECGLTGLTVNINAREVCKYYKVKKQSMKGTENE